MSSIQTYSNPSNAKRAAKKVLTPEQFAKAQVKLHEVTDGNDIVIRYTFEPVTKAYTEMLTGLSVPKTGNRLVVNKARKAAPSKGIKIEKDRDEQNGVKRPSLGGACRKVWDACDELYDNGVMPKPAVIKPIAEENGWNVNNTIIEMYQWRKFMGIRGRQN